MARDFFSTSTRVWVDDEEEKPRPIGQAVVSRDFRDFEVRAPLLHPRDRGRRPRKSRKNDRRRLRLTDEFILEANQVLENRAHSVQQKLHRLLVRALNNRDSPDALRSIFPADFAQKLDQQEQARLENLDEGLFRATVDAQFEFREDRSLRLMLSWALRACESPEESFDDVLFQELLFEAHELIESEGKEDRSYG